MLRRRAWCWMFVSSVLALTTMGCGSDGGSSDDTDDGGEGAEHLIELFSWWIAPGEAEALQALVDAHKAKDPNARILNTAADTRIDARELLQQRLADNKPPDLYQQNAHDVRTWLEENPGTLQPLDDFFAEQGFDTAILPEVIENVTIDGKIYAMPVNMHRENSLFYNKTLFAAHNLTPPTTLSELVEVCETLKAAGVTPIATSHEAWILRIMFNSIAMASMGTTAYHAYFTGSAPLDEEAMRTAAATFRDLVVNYANANAGDEGFGWTHAAQALHDGEAAMFLHGDWAKAYLTQLGWTPDLDFGVVGAPGASDLFFYGIDTFVFPTGAPNEPGARDFLSTIGSKEAQVAFNTLKGSSPIRLDVPKDQLDATARATLEDLEKARLRMIVRSKDAWDTAIRDYVLNENLDGLIQAYRDNPPE